MISLESKTQTSTPSSPLNLAPKEEGSGITNAFSEMLRGARIAKEDTPVQNGVLVMSLEEELKSTKTNTLLDLLKGESTLLVELNPEIKKKISPQELKALIKDAKTYLKDKIISSEGFKKAEIASLPKTLKGLAQVAQKFGIEISKITLEEVQKKLPDTDKNLQKTNSVDTDSDALVQKSKIEEGLDTRTQLEIKKGSKKAQILPKNQTAQESATIDDTINQESSKDIKIKKAPKELKTTPLFKAQTSKEITTQQFVHTKISTTETVSAKRKADETLKLLLRSEKVTKNEKGLTADFSVATARVLAPEATTNTSKALEALLKGESISTQENTKVDAFNLAKADSFEVKLNEAKQMTKYLSADIKTAIEDYKSPFTRVKVDLNPQRLGSVELTVVQRGKNLHINISSNNTAINTLALNSNDLKVQLANNGINNASLNFNNNSQSSQQGSFGQQQNPQHEREAREEYNYIQSEEQHEEILSSLEIVVPYYA